MFLQFPEPVLGRTRSTRKDSVRVTESFGIGMMRQNSGSHRHAPHRRFSWITRRTVLFTPGGSGTDSATGNRPIRPRPSLSTHLHGSECVPGHPMGSSKTACDTIWLSSWATRANTSCSSELNPEGLSSLAAPSQASGGPVCAPMP